MRIADVLRNKGAAVATVAPETTVSELLAELASTQHRGNGGDRDRRTCRHRFGT